MISFGFKLQNDTFVHWELCRCALLADTRYCSVSVKTVADNTAAEHGAAEKSDWTPKSLYRFVYHIYGCGLCFETSTCYVRVSFRFKGHVYTKGGGESLRSVSRATVQLSQHHLSRSLFYSFVSRSTAPIPETVQYLLIFLGENTRFARLMSVARFLTRNFFFYRK